MPKQKHLSENMVIPTEEQQMSTPDFKEECLYNRMEEKNNLKIKVEMAKELLSTGLSRQAIKRILNLPTEIISSKER